MQSRLCTATKEWRLTSPWRRLDREPESQGTILLLRGGNRKGTVCSYHSWSKTMHFYVYRDTRHEWRWRLVAGNYKTLADSGEGYVNRLDCVRILNVLAGNARIPIRYQE